MYMVNLSTQICYQWCEIVQINFISGVVWTDSQHEHKTVWVQSNSHSLALICNTFYILYICLSNREFLNSLLFNAYISEGIYLNPLRACRHWEAFSVTDFSVIVLLSNVHFILITVFSICCAMLMIACLIGSGWRLEACREPTKYDPLCWIHAFQFLSSLLMQLTENELQSIVLCTKVMTLLSVQLQCHRACQSLVQNIKALYEAWRGAEWVTSTGCHIEDTLWKHAQPFPGWKSVLFKLLRTLSLKKVRVFFFFLKPK